jgi:cytochrome b6-f complex iron-sulfur subunit
MDRKEFLTSIGMTTAAAALFTCIGCSKDSENPSGTSGPSGVDFTLDLSVSANAALLNNGGYVATNGVIVAKTIAGNYIAVQRSCTHENYSLIYQGNKNRFFCNNHGAVFSESGAVEQGPARSPLAVYKTSLNGNTLRIYS